MDRAKTILYLWLGSTVALFSLSSFKLDYYLLPAMPARALIVGLIISSTKKVTSTTRVAQVFLIVCCLLIILAALLSARAAGQLQAGELLRFLPLITALGGAGVVGFHAVRPNVWGASMALCGVIAATFLSCQLVLLPLFVSYLPVGQLVSNAPKDRVWFTSSAAGDWANDLVFNLPIPHRIERLTEDKYNHKLLEILKEDQRAIALVRERDLDLLAPGDPTIKVLARAETYGHGGLSLNMLRQPKRQGLLVIGH